MKNVVILPDAEADIVDIWHHTIDRWGFDQAVRYDAMMQERIEGLASGRTASQKVDGIRSRMRRALVGQHVVFFREDDEAVTVVRVLHQRMDVGRV
ncbi:MAG: type II toxin-antitoxin system RelE/ParE family toxin [Pseudomonadota bacterium]